MPTDMMTTPRFLMGAAILFWGWQTQIIGLAIGMAVILELSHWVKWRVEISLIDCNRIWDLCCLLTVMAGLYCVLTSDTANELAVLFQSNFAAHNAAAQELSGVSKVFFQWWPILLFPMAAAQAFGTRAVVPYTTYSILARRNLRRQGKAQAETPGVNFSFPFFAVCLFSASLSSRNPMIYFWCFMGLCVWAFWSARSRRSAPLVWVILMAALVGGGYVGQRELPKYVSKIEGEVAGWFVEYLRGDTAKMEIDTKIGDVVKLKGSGLITMRVTSAGGKVPELLRDEVYTRFNGWRWENRRSVRGVKVPPTQAGDLWYLRDSPLATNEVTISTMLRAQSTVISRPSGTYFIDRLPVSKVTTNELGTVRSFGGPPFVVYKAAYGSDGTVDTRPKMRRYHPPRVGIRRGRDSLTDNNKVLEAVSREIGLYYKQDPAEMGELISHFFEDKFEYQISTPALVPEEAEEEYLIPYFLRENRRGHCELFATATVELMRYNSVPARYVVGWSVQESGDSPGEYIVRMRHAHAWCRYWSDEDGQWHDLDTTPPNWFAEETAAAPFYEPLLDWWSNGLQSFRMWRYYGDSGEVQEYLLVALGILVAILSWRIVVRLRRREKAVEDVEFWEFAKLGLDSEFYEIEKRIRALGLVRRDGESLLDWLHRLEDREEVRPRLLRQIIDLHYRYRFDPQGLSDGDRDNLRGVVREWLTPLKPVNATA